MDEQQLQLLYGDYAKDKGFKDYNEFKSLMSNESSRKVFFDESNKDLGFKDYEEMNSLLKVKKKADSSGVSSTSNGQGLVSETPSGSLGGQKSDKLWEQPIDNTLDFTQNLNLQGIPKNSSLDESVVSKIKSHFPKTEPTKKEIRNDINNNIVTESTRVQKPKQTTLKDIEKEKEIIGNILNLEVPKLRSATAVTAQENSEIESDLVSKKEQSGIWNNIKAYGKTAINKAQEFVWGMTDEGTTPQELIINKDPLKEEKKQSKKELIENGLKNPTDIEINENADKIFIKNKQDAIKQQKYQDYIETLDDNKKTLLEVDAHIRFKTIGKESNDISNRILGNKKAIQDLDNLLNNPNINQQDKDLILKDKQNIEIQNQKDFASYTKKLDDLGSAEEEFDALKRNYGAIYNFTERVQNSIHNVGLGLVSAVGFAQKYNGNPFGELMNLQAQEYVSTQKENLEKRKEFLRPDNKELTLSNFVQYSTDLIANQSGTLIAIGTTGGVGGAAILGASQVGETANEMHNDMKQGAIYTPEQVAIAPILSGLSTAILSELPTGKTLASSGRIFASAFKSESGKVILKEATKKTTQGILNEIGKNYKREIPTELLDNIIQNTIKKDILGDTSVGYFDNSLQTLQDTALMTSLFSLSAVPHVTGYAINKYTPKEKLNELKENAKKIIELKSSITTDLSPLIKQEIEKTITKTTKKSTDIINNTFENIGKMNPENAQKILDNEKKKNNIKETAKEIQSNTEITDDSKKILLADLKIEHSLISEESESIITENQQTVEQSTKEPVEVENNEQPIEKEVAPSVSLSKEDITEIHDKINNTTNVVIREKNIDGEGYFAFPNEGVFGEVEKVGVKDNATAYTYSNDFKIKDLHSEGVVFDDYMKDVDVKQLRKDGFDAVSVMEIDGSKVLHILKPEKLTLLDNRLPDLRKNNVNLQPENNLENGNTETNKRTESDSVQKNSTINTEKKIDSRKRGVGEKPKFLKEKISFNQRKVKDKTMLTALDHEAVDFYDLLQQALIGGVKLTPDALKEVIASKNSIGKEVQSRMQYIRTAEKGGISFNDLVHQIFETALEKFNDADIRNELIEILKNNTTTKQMALEYTDRHDLHQKDKEGNRINEDGEILYETQYGLLTNAEIEDIYTFEKEQNIKLDKETANETLQEIDQLTDAEIVQLSKDKDDFDEYMAKLESQKANQVLDNKPTAETPTPEVKDSVKPEIPKEIIGTLDKLFDFSDTQDISSSIEDMIKNLKGNTYSQALPITPVLIKFLEAVNLAVKTGNLVGNAAKMAAAKILEEFEKIHPKEIIDEIRKQTGIEKTSESKPVEVHTEKDMVYDGTAYNLPTTEKKVQSAKDLGITLKEYDDITDLAESFEYEDGFKYESGKTINREYSETTNDQSTQSMILINAAKHGFDVLEKMVKVFGEDKYISKTIDFLLNSDLDPLDKTFVYHALEKELYNLIKKNPKDVNLRKLQDLVRSDNQKLASRASKIVSAGRLRSINNELKNGIDYDNYTNQLLTKEQETGRKELRSVNFGSESVNAFEEQGHIEDAEIKKYSQQEMDNAIAEASKGNKDFISPTEKEQRIKKANDLLDGLLDNLSKNKKPKSENKPTYNSNNDFTAESLSSTHQKTIIEIGKLLVDIKDKQEIIDLIDSKLPNLGKEKIESILDKGKVFEPKKKKTFSQSPEAQRKRYVKLLEESVRRLDEQIANKRKDIVNREDKYKNDEEIKALREERDTKKKELLKADPEYQKRKDAENYQNKLDRKIADAEKKISDIENGVEKDFNGKSSEWSADLSDVKQRLKALREEKAKLTPTALVKQALIDAGFGREIKTKNGIVSTIDWVKLAGRNSSIESLRANVEEQLAKKGMSKSEISKMKNLLENEYKKLQIAILDKADADSERQNKIKPSPNSKSINRQMVDLYNQGLFKKENIDKYENLVLRKLGLNTFDLQQHKKVTDALDKLSYILDLKDENGNKLTELSTRTLASQVNHEIKAILHSTAFKNGNKLYKSMDVLNEIFVNLGLKTLLQNPANGVENITSGLYQDLLSRISEKKYLTKEDVRQFIKDGNVLFSDVGVNHGLTFGDVGHSMTSESRFEEWFHQLAKNGDEQISSKLLQSSLSFVSGKIYLEAADSANKAFLTQVYFKTNMVEILSNSTNKNRMTLEDAQKFVSEKTTGISFDMAKNKAKTIIEEHNDRMDKMGSPKHKIDNSDRSVHRFAMDLVRENLISQSGGLITEYQISSAYDAAYRAAGRDLGHVGNNAMSAWLLPKINEKIGGNIKKAVKDKNWNKASLLMATNIITKTALFPFKGGGYNWVVLTLEKLGLPIGNIERGIEGEHTIDMSTQVGMNKLKTNLYNKQVIKSTNYRNGAGILMGGLIAAGAYMTFRSGDEDDNDPKSNSKKLAGWLEDNEWAKSYFYKLSPSALSIITSRENKEMGMLLYKLSGSDDPLFDKKLKFFKNLEKNDGRGMGRFGEAMGSPFNVPVPSWKWGKDIAKVYKGINDMEIYKVNQDVNTIENGMLKGGFFEWTGLRPENAEVEKEISLKKAENGVQDSKDFSNSELDKELSKRKEKENLTDREVVLKKAKTKKEGLEDELKEVLLQLRAKENNTVYLKQNGKPKVKDKKSGTKYLLGRKEYLENKIEFIKKESKN